MYTFRAINDRDAKNYIENSSIIEDIVTLRDALTKRNKVIYSFYHVYK